MTAPTRPILAKGNLLAINASIWMAAAIAMIFLLVLRDAADLTGLHIVGVIVAVSGLPILFRRMTDKHTSIDGKTRRSHYRGALKLAEEHAGIGRWRIDYETGLQSWSDSLCAAHGVVSGSTAGEDVWSVLEHHGADTEPFRFEVEVPKTDGSDCVLRIFARNHYSVTGRLIETYGVVIDVTRDYDHFQAISEAYSAAQAEAERARELAMTDSLTGLANRRRAMAELDRQIVASRNQKKRLSVVMFDIDHFKAVNDTYGHPAGDAILRKVADIASEATRKNDLVARIGGEEFLWIMPDTNEATVKKASERLRAAMERGSAAGGAPPITISAGFVTCTECDTGLAVFARADEALYAAKDAGRNQIKKAA